MKFNHHAGRRDKVRYAVVGLGHIAQNAILPAFKHPAMNSELTALVSDDPAKLRFLSHEYGVRHCFDYEEYDECLHSGEIDAVYIAVPNHLHAEYCSRAAAAGIHVLCEKPLAVTEDECQRIIDACKETGVKLMTAYRLHFEHGNLEAINIIRSGEIGEPRIFNSVFTNVRTEPEKGGGTLYDIGIYCINAARYLFADEPVAAFCMCAAGADPRFHKVEEMASAILRFPQARLASFTASFGAADTAEFEVVGTRGRLRASQAYDFAYPVALEVTVEGRRRRRFYGLRDQFAPELIYFSDCIQHDREPEPSGLEGLRDVHIIRSLYQSAKTGAPVKFEGVRRRRYPDLRQEIYRPRIVKPTLVRVAAPTA